MTDRIAPPDALFSLFANGETLAMNVDGTTPVNFDVTCPANRLYYVVHRICMVMTGTSLRLNRFGPLAKLTNGLQVLAVDDTGDTMLDYTAGQNIKMLSDFALLAGLDSVIEPSAGDDVWFLRWTIGKSGQQHVIETGESIRIVVQDHLSNAALTDFRAMAQGWYGGTI